ncbi:MAG: hypothetical protein ACYTDU_06370 [Planctomycetota bacterium]|jgi:hypothetical protein
MEPKTTAELRHETDSLLQDAKGQAGKYDRVMGIERSAPERALSDAVLKLCEAAFRLDERLRRLEKQ